MQRVAVTLLLGVIGILSLSGCANVQPLPLRQIPDSQPWIHAEPMLGHNPWRHDVTHTFECVTAGMVTVSLSRTSNGGVEILDLRWNSRRPTTDESSLINSDISAFSQLRSVSLTCGGNRNLLLFEFWDAHEGVRRLAIRMDAEGFRLESPPPDGDVPE